MADTNTNEGSARANDKQQSIYTTKKISILTITTQREGGATVCHDHVCFPVCALISISAAVQVKAVNQVEGKGRNARGREPTFSRLICRWGHCRIDVED